MKRHARVDFKEGHVTGTNTIHWPSELSIQVLNTPLMLKTLVRSKAGHWLCPLQVLDCRAIPAHTCVWGRLLQNPSVLASLLLQLPLKPHATSTYSIKELLEANFGVHATVATRKWACDLAVGMLVFSVKSTLITNCLQCPSSMVIFHHDRLLIQKEDE